jgi:hypothetical protein
MKFSSGIIVAKELKFLYKTEQDIDLREVYRDDRVAIFEWTRE